MIAEVQKALTAYTRLDSTGKRLFRDELGLVRPQQATKRRRRKPAAADVPAETQHTVRRGRGRRVEVTTGATAPAGAQPASK